MEILTVLRLLDQGAVPFRDIPEGGCFRTIADDGKAEPGLNRRVEPTRRANVLVTFPPDRISPFGSQSTWKADPWLLVYPIAREENPREEEQAAKAN